MRTTMKALAKLMREAREALGVKTNGELWTHAAKAQAYFAKALSLGENAVTLSPYADNAWTLSWYTSDGHGCIRGHRHYLNLEDWMDAPFTTAKRILAS